MTKNICICRYRQHFCIDNVFYPHIVELQINVTENLKLNIKTIYRVT